MNASNCVKQWFGHHFEDLDPLLQVLHQSGGELVGKVRLVYGSGVAGLLGKRLAAKLGLPLTPGLLDFKVEILHEQDRLIWRRRFSDNQFMTSVFKPEGSFPSGLWYESTGAVKLGLSVRIVDGGWYWVPRKAWIGNIPIPLFLLPKTKAYKRVENGEYEFSVTISLPLLGDLVSYSGVLSPGGVAAH